MIVLKNTSSWNNDKTIGPTSHDSVLKIVLTCIGTLLVMVFLVVVILCGVYVYRRNIQRKRGQYSAMCMDMHTKYLSLSMQRVLV